VAVIVPAAGERGEDFLLWPAKPARLPGRPVWQRSAELFWTRLDVARVYLVVSPDDLDEFRSRFGHLLMFANAELVPGGAERFDSVANALARVPTDVEFVAVHDAARPLVSPAQIDAVFDAALQHGAALLARPVADTLKRVQDDIITATVPRAGLWAAQTPQVARRDWLVDAYARRAELGADITDDAQLLEAAGHAVRVVPGSATNFKITTPDDFALAELHLGGPAKEPENRPAFERDTEW
jgi:2-C-methyl-D-erythritol 4-phosphate cytidylyltransferase